MSAKHEKTDTSYLDVSYSYSPSFPRTKKKVIVREEEEIKEERYSYHQVEKPDKEK